MINSKNYIQVNLIKIFINIFGLNKKEITNKKIMNISEKNFKKWDSLRKLNLLISIEKQFEIKIKNSDVEKLNSFNDAMKIIENSKKNVS